MTDEEFANLKLGLPDERYISFKGTRNRYGHNDWASFIACNPASGVRAFLWNAAEGDFFHLQVSFADTEKNSTHQLRKEFTSTDGVGNIHHAEGLLASVAMIHHITKKLKRKRRGRVTSSTAPKLPPK